MTNTHRGEQADAAGDRIKALLAPLEADCGYRERRSEGWAQFDVEPRRPDAIAWSIIIAPGGINVESRVLEIKELAIEEADFAVALVEAILAGRVRQVRRLGSNGGVRVAKTYVSDATGRFLFKQRRGRALAFLAGRGRVERVRFAAYA